MAEKTQRKHRVVIDGLPWVRHDLGDNEERWKLDIEGIHIWVKDYGPGPKRKGDPWWGWRIGVGGSPVGDHHPDRDTAMHAATRVAQVTATRRVDQKIEELTAAQTTLREVVVTL